VLTVDDVLALPGLEGSRRLSTTGGSRRPAVVDLVERLEALRAVPSESWVFLSERCAAETTAYEVDLALRHAASRGAAAIASPASPANRWADPSATALEIARRAGIALVRLGPTTPSVTGLLHADRALTRNAGSQLARAAAALDDVLRAVAEGESVPRLLDLASERFGSPVEACPYACAVSSPLLPRSEGGTGQAPTRPETARVGRSGLPDHGPIATELASEGLDGATALFVCARSVIAQDVAAARLLVNSLAAVIGRQLALAADSRDIPLRTRSQLLNGLLFLDSAHQEDLLAEARRLAMPIDGWHVAAYVQVDLPESPRDEERRLALSEAVSRVALAHCQRVGGTWTHTSNWTAIVLVQMTTARPEPQRPRRIVDALDGALRELVERFPDAHVGAGIGGVHEGIPGIRTSVKEARAVLAGARASGNDRPVVAFDAYGIQRALMEWYASDPTQEAVAVQLAPLMELGARRRDVAIRTLKTYLDEQGSLTRTSRALGLHRNAVAYRLEQIKRLMGSDLSDADERLALQLACRAYVVGAA
jgi:sugar diacid utilization regulator